ncbi:unnamed protein product, partial [Durusdinium trenchii]
DQLKRTEEALVQERGNAVAQAKALAELQVQFKRLQDQPSQHEAISRAQQEELMQLRGELRRLEEVFLMGTMVEGLLISSWLLWATLARSHILKLLRLRFVALVSLCVCSVVPVLWDYNG